MSDIVGPSQLPVAGDLEPERDWQGEYDSDDDHDWQREYDDFVFDVAAGENKSDGDTPTFSEHPLQELGLYDKDEDVSNWPFERAFADDQWQDPSITLLQNTNNFSGPVPGPTSALVSCPIDYFMRYWPPHLLQ